MNTSNPSFFIRRVTFLVTLFAAAPTWAQVCPASGIPDNTQFTAAVFLGYEPLRAEDVVLKTARALAERSPETKLYLLMSRADRARLAQIQPHCASELSDPRLADLCRVVDLIRDPARAVVIPVAQVEPVTYAQDFLQFAQSHGRTLLLPVEHPSETNVENRPVGGTITESVAAALGLTMMPLDVSDPRGTDRTMGGNIESLPGGVIVVGDNGSGTENVSDQKLRRLFRQLRPDVAAGRSRVRMEDLVGVTREAERTEQALVDLLKGANHGLLKIDTQGTPIGHADEVFSVVRSNAACGFSVLVPSPRLAFELLAQAPPSEGGRCIRRSPREKPGYGDDRQRITEHARAGCVGTRGATVRDVLGNPTYRKFNARLDLTARENKKWLAFALERVCARVDFVDVPYLVAPSSNPQAPPIEPLFPNPVNALVISPRAGPSIWINNPTFVPIFDDYIRGALSRRGVDVRTTWTSSFFEGSGGIHCGSATMQVCTGAPH